MKKYLYSSLVLLLIDSSSGVISTFAGKGKKFGYWGDGDLATNANFDSPRGVAMDSDGNIYIADSSGNCIRKVSSGKISALVGKVGLVITADINFPCGVAVDSNRNLYIADTNNHCIRKVDLTSNNISVIAGSDSGTPGYSGDGGPAINAKLATPSGVAVDSHGNIYIAEYHNDCIRKVNSEGIISTFVGNKDSAIIADLKGPRGVAVDSDGNVYIADTDNHRVLKVINPNNN